MGTATLRTWLYTFGCNGVLKSVLSPPCIEECSSALKVVLVANPLSVLFQVPPPHDDVRTAPLTSSDALLTRKAGGCIVKN